MHFVEGLGLGRRQVQHAGCDDAQPGALEAGVDVADQVAGNTVGLDDGKGALERHQQYSLENEKQPVKRPGSLAVQGLVQQSHCRWKYRKGKVF
jgi:hypothetical protein